MDQLELYLGAQLIQLPKQNRKTMSNHFNPSYVHLHTNWPLAAVAAVVVAAAALLMTGSIIMLVPIYLSVFYM